METPFVAGVCLAYMPSVSYNGVGCYPFVYGGCGGTRNRFRTLEECTKVCMDSEFLKQTMVVFLFKKSHLSGPCEDVPAKTGTDCGKSFPRYTFDGKECKKFGFSCCGNRNNFPTKDVCERTCIKREPCDYFN